MDQYVFKRTLSDKELDFGMQTVAQYYIFRTDVSITDDADRRVLFIGDIHGMKESLEYVYCLLRSQSRNILQFVS